ncbi:MAG: histidine phosphatase family protein [Rickettsiales bacterium]|jgi:phosphohistidine phosphatase SixA|nr:histidine phosphatase family protein [Rickettsiales bacterium]
MSEQFNKILMRHSIYSGQDLIPLGVIQSLHAGEFFAALNKDTLKEFPQITDIFHTSVDRTRQTAEIIAMAYKAFGLPGPTLHEEKGGERGGLISKIAYNYKVTDNTAILAIGHEPDFREAFNSMSVLGNKKHNWEKGSGIMLNSNREAGRSFSDFVFDYSSPCMLNGGLALVLKLQKLGFQDEPIKCAEHILNDTDLINSLFGNAINNYQILPVKNAGR